MGLLNTMETILTVMEDHAVHARLEPVVLQAVHQNYAGKESILKQLCLSVWWPGISKHVRDFVESYKTCVALGKRVKNYDMAPIGICVLECIYPYICFETTLMLKKQDICCEVCLAQHISPSLNISRYLATYVPIYFVRYQHM